MSLGIAGGQGLSGLIAPTMGWRFPFLLVAIPPMILSLIIPFVTAEPKRGEMEEEVRQYRKHHRNRQLIASQIVNPIHQQSITYQASLESSNSVSRMCSIQLENDKVSSSSSSSSLWSSSSWSSFLEYHEN